MAIFYKLDILEELKKKGFNTYVILKGNLINQGSLQSIREKKPISFKTLNTLCKLLELQPGDIIGYKED